MCMKGDHFWIGTTNAGLFGFTLTGVDPDPAKRVVRNLVAFSAVDGIGSNWVSALHQDAAGALWIATIGGGLSVLKRDTLRNITRGGLSEDTFHALVEDLTGCLWLSSNNGLYKVQRSSIEAYLDGRIPEYPVTRFGVSSGMRSDECDGGTQSAGLLSHSGKLFFPTTEGVVMATSDTEWTKMVAPSVSMERVLVNRQAVSSEYSVMTSRGDGNLEFSWTGISLAFPDGVRYRVMLEGYDKDWLDVGNRRQVSYTNIPSGSYRFRVRAGNADDVWNTAGATFDVVLTPYFYQTIWFYALCGVVVASLAGAFLTMYRRQKERQLIASQLESQLAQARLRTLEMQVQPHFLFNALNGISALIEEDPEKANVMIGRLSDFIRMALDRNGVQEISLREELQFVDGYLDVEQLRFSDRLTVHHDIEEACLNALVPTMLLQPIVENAIRHGVAKRRGPVSIHLHARRENGNLRLFVTDDGPGLPTPEKLHVGIGLFNTRARLQHLYGTHQRCDLSSPPSGGTRVDLVLPFHQEPVLL